MNCRRKANIWKRDAKIHLDMDVASTSYHWPSDINVDICDSCENDNDEVDFKPGNEERANQQNIFTYEYPAIADTGGWNHWKDKEKRNVSDVCGHANQCLQFFDALIVKASLSS
ncbi:Hypothetical predicted protein [Octopus vulgaris]|uniref:Uncharacterized protein n=1 Tax=Octopus vulgaris TaxID=6645 RepID=A0AA36FDI5_OCTVU|nr:Hypothetical predicted protein [Octopus vulgaris]